MSNTIVTSQQQVNLNSVNLRPLPRVEYAFAPIPLDLIERVPRHLHAFVSKLVELWRLGIDDPSQRELAAIFSVTRETIRLWLRSLERLGLMANEIRRETYDRCKTSIFKLFGFGPKGGGVPQTDLGEKPLDLKTTTSTAPRKDPRAAYDARREQDRKDNLRMRKWYEARKTAWEEGRVAYNRTKSAIEAGSSWLRTRLAQGTRLNEQNEEYLKKAGFYEWLEREESKQNG